MNRLEDEINALSRTRTHAELVAGVQKIFRTMSFYISQSEGAVLEYHEQWRGDYANALYSEASTSKEGGAPPKARPSAGAPRHTCPCGAEAVYHSKNDNGDSVRLCKAHAPSSKGKSRPRESKAARQQAAVAQTAASRSRQEDIPDSLRAILEGTHPSFKDDDEF